MSRWWIVALVAVAIVAGLAIEALYGETLDLYAVRGNASPTTTPCEKTAGYIQGPFVADPETARRIFEAVAARLMTDELMRRYEVTIDEEPEYWAVFQSLRNEPDMRGGGGLSMHINKCTGAVSNVYYQK